MRSLLFVGIVVWMYSSCSYSFKGIDIPTDVKTYYIENFQNEAIQAPGDLGQRFTEALRAKIRNESRLTHSEASPDIEFSGSIVRFTITPEAPKEGNTVALNKFEIGVSVNYFNNQDDTKNWKAKQFTFFRTFESDKDFISIQDKLIDEIFKQLLENIFNEAFTGW